MADGGSPSDVSLRQQVGNCKDLNEVQKDYLDVVCKLKQIIEKLETSKKKGECVIDMKTSLYFSDHQVVAQEATALSLKAEELFLTHAESHIKGYRDSGFCNSTSSLQGVTDKENAMAERSDYCLSTDHTQPLALTLVTGGVQQDDREAYC